MTSEVNSRKSRVTYWIKFAIRVVILALVTWGVWRTALSARGEFVRTGIALNELNWGWLAAAMLFYIAGMFPSCIFWWRTLRAMGQRPTFAETLRAFYVGHLGKYVPGKALVVVIRTGLIRSERVDTTVAATSVFVETLTLMSVGAVVAAGILGALLRTQPGFVLLALFLAVGAGVPTYPPLFRRTLRFLQVHRANPDIDKAIEGLNARLMGLGWLLISIGWVCFGLSLWATAQAIPGAISAPTLNDLPLLTAAVSLAMVAGFLSLLPGGLGVRELIVIPLLQPNFGPVVAILSAVLLRVCWMAAEILIASVLYITVRSPKSREASARIDLSAARDANCNGVRCDAS